MDPNKEIMDKLGEVGTELVAIQTEARAGLKENIEAREALRTSVIDTQKELQAVTRKLAGEEAARKVLEDRLEETNRLLARGGTAAAPNEAQMRQEARACLRDFARNGMTGELVQRSMKEAQETRTLNEVVGSQGGYLVPAFFEAEIIKAEYNVSDLRPLATVKRNPGPTWEGPKRTGLPTLHWTSGGGTASEPTYGLERIIKHPNVIHVPLHIDLMNDRQDIESEIREGVEIAVMQGEGPAFVTGGGVDRPEGFTINAENIANRVAGVESVNNKVEFKDFINLAYGKGAAGEGVQTAYRRNGVYVLNSNTLRDVMGLEDGVGRPVWDFQAGYADGPRTTIAGKPYQVFEDMPDQGATSYPVAFADFKRAYYVCDDSDIYFVNDNLTSFPNILFKWRRRLGGQTVNAGAIRLLYLA